MKEDIDQAKEMKIKKKELDSYINAEDVALLNVKMFQLRQEMEELIKEKDRYKQTAERFFKELSKSSFVIHEIKSVLQVLEESEEKE